MVYLPISKESENKSSSAAHRSKDRKMAAQVICWLSGACALSHHLFWRLLLALQVVIEFLRLVVRVFPAVYAEPVAVGNAVVEGGVAVDVAAVEVAAVADEQHVLIVSQSTLVAGVVVVLAHQHELLRLHTHPLRLADPAFAAHQLEDVVEGTAAAGTDSRGLTPLLDAVEAELVLAGQSAADGVVAVEADRTHRLELAALLVGDLRGLFQLLPGRRRSLSFERRGFSSLLDGVGKQQSPFLVVVWLGVVVPADLFHACLGSEGPGGGSGVEFAGRSDACVIEGCVGVEFGVGKRLLVRHDSNYLIIRLPH